MTLFKGLMLPDFHQAGNVNAFLTTSSGTPSSFPNNLLQYQSEVSVKSRVGWIHTKWNISNFSDFSIMDLHVKLNFVKSYKTAGLIFRKKGFKED